MKNLVTLIASTINIIHSFFFKVTPHVLIAALIAIIAGVALSSEMILIPAVGIFLLFLCFYFCNIALKNNVMALLGVVSLFGHFLLALIINVIFTDFGVDSLDYHLVAYSFFECMLTGENLFSIPIHKNIFTHMVAVIYYVLVPSRIVATFFVCFFAVMTGVMVYLLSEAVGWGEFTGRIAALGVWFLPSYLFFNSDLLRDSLVLFLVAFSFYLLALLIYKKNSWHTNILLLVALILSIGINSALRFYIFFPIVAGIGVTLLISFLAKKSLKQYLVMLPIFILFCLLSFFLLQSFLGHHAELFFNDPDSFFYRLNYYRHHQFVYNWEYTDDGWIAIQANAAIPGFDISTVRNAFLHLPVLTIHYMLQPFPSNWFLLGTLMQQLPLIPDMIIWYFGIPFMLFGMYITIRNKHTLGIAMIVYLLVLLVSNSLIVGNIGAIYRYRMQFQILAFLFIGMGIMHVIDMFRRRCKC